MAATSTMTKMTIKETENERKKSSAAMFERTRAGQGKESMWFQGRSGRQMGERKDANSADSGASRSSSILSPKALYSAMVQSDTFRIPSEGRVASSSSSKSRSSSSKGKAPFV